MIDGCTVLDSEWNNIMVESSKFGGITNTLVGHPSSSQYKDDSDGITVQNSQYIRIENCQAIQNGEDGIDIGGHVGGDIAHISVVNCIAKDNYGKGIAHSVTNDGSFDGYDITIAKCLSINNLDSGIMLYQEPDDVRVVHNTAANTNFGLHIRPESPNDLDIKNNIFAFNTYNLIHNNVAIDSLNITYNNWGLVAPPFPYDGTVSFVEDPEFVSASLNDYTIQSSSPCIDAATDLTYCTAAGFSDTIPVAKSSYFCDGYKMLPGDQIRIGSNNLNVLSIPDEFTIVVDQAISFSIGDPVNFTFEGYAPDLGYWESPYSSSNYCPNAMEITIWAAGDSNQESMQLMINDSLVATYDNVTGDFQNRVFFPYSYNYCDAAPIECMSIHLSNGDVVNGIDNNLRIDRIAINGVNYQTENADVLGNGVYDGTCATGYYQTEKLYCSGYFWFGFKCIAEMYLNQNRVLSGIYQSSNLIESNSQLWPGDNISFKSQDINLQNGFEVQLGSEFNAEIETCP